MMAEGEMKHNKIYLDQAGHDSLGYYAAREGLSTSRFVFEMLRKWALEKDNAVLKLPEAWAGFERGDVRIIEPERALDGTKLSTHRVVLRRPPEHPVTVKIGVSRTMSGAFVTPSKMFFDEGNWGVPQALQLAGATTGINPVIIDVNRTR